jgi:tetratricopeptide (TPR) repeat protein
VRHGQHQLRLINDQLTPETPRREREVYEAALDRAPDDVLLRGNYAQFLEVTGARAAAIQHGQQVCELLPDLAWPHYYLGALLAREGRIQEAAACFERALAIRSDFTQARTELRRIQSGHRW